MNEKDKFNLAFFKAFDEEMGQYDVTLEQFVAYLEDRWDSNGSNGYTQLADAYNLWGTAVEFGRNNSKQGE